MYKLIRKIIRGIVIIPWVLIILLLSPIIFIVLIVICDDWEEVKDMFVIIAGLREV